MKKPADVEYDDNGNPVNVDGDDAGEEYDDSGQRVVSAAAAAVAPATAAAAPTPVDRFSPEKFGELGAGGGTRGALTMPEFWKDAARGLPENLLGAAMPAYAASRGYLKEQRGEPTSTTEDIALGAGKSLGGTVSGLGKLATDAMSYWNSGPAPPGSKPGPFDDLDKLRGDLGLEPRGFTQQAAGVAEQIGEAMLPAGSVNRGIQMVGKGQKLARLMAIMGLEGAAGYGTTLARTGGNSKEAAQSALLGAGGRGLLSLSTVFRTRPKEAQELMELAAEFGVPLDKAQQTQSAVMQLFKGVTKGSAMGSLVFNKFDLKQNKKIAEAAATQIMDLSRSMDPKTAGEFVQESLTQADKISRQEYAGVVDAILQRSGKTKLAVEEGSNLHRRASELLDQWSLQFLEGAEGSVDDIKRAKDLLGRFVHVSKEVDTGILNAQGGAVTKRVTKELDFEEAKKIRTLLYKIADSDQVTIGKGELRQLNHALDKEIAAALERAGKAEDAQLFRAAGAQFRQTRELLEEKVIEQMAKSGTPETILDTLLRPGAETRAETLRRLIHKEGMDKVRTALWARMLDPKSASQDNVLMGQKLKKMLDDMGPGAKEAIFGDRALVGKIERFASMADRLRVPANLPQRIEQGVVPLAGQFGARQLAGNLVTGVISAGAGAGGGLVVGAGTAGALVLTPGALAWMMTKPSVVDDMIRALATDPATSAGKALTAKILAYAQQAMSRERRANPEKDMRDWLANPQHPDRRQGGGGAGAGAIPPPPTG